MTNEEIAARSGGLRVILRGRTPDGEERTQILTFPGPRAHKTIVLEDRWPTVTEIDVERLEAEAADVPALREGPGKTANAFMRDLGEEEVRKREADKTRGTSPEAPGDGAGGSGQPLRAVSASSGPAQEVGADLPRPPGVQQNPDGTFSFGCAAVPYREEDAGKAKLDPPAEAGPAQAEPHGEATGPREWLAG